MIGADAKGAPKFFSSFHQRRERLVKALEFLIVLGIRILTNSEFFFVDVVAGVDPNFLNVLNCFHRCLG